MELQLIYRGDRNITYQFFCTIFLYYALAVLFHKEVVKHLETNPTMKQKVINAVKEGGLAAFEKAIDNPAGAFITGAVKGWQEVKNN